MSLFQSTDHRCKRSHDAIELWFTEKESIGQKAFTSSLSWLLRSHMCALYQPATWQFSDSSMRFTYESITSPRNTNSFVMQAQDQFDDGSTEPIAKLVGQCFTDAFSEELQLRGLVAGRTVMRTLTGTETLARDRRRTRVVVDVITEASGATQNELIDALAGAKRRCSAKVGSDIKILLKAELKSETFELGFLTDSRPRSLSAE